MSFRFGFGAMNGSTGGFPPPPLTLGALSLSPDNVTQNVAATINILGATGGSTLTVTAGALPTGMTLNSAARTMPTTALRCARCWPAPPTARVKLRSTST